MKLMDMTIPGSLNKSFDGRQVAPQLVLELLNHAVWAPNHKLRQPWRFHYIPSGEKLEGLASEMHAHLVVTLPIDHNRSRYDENLAAVFCLIQNMKLLGEERGLSVDVTFPKWMYKRAHCRKLGIPDHENVAAVLDLAYYTNTKETETVPLPPAAALNWSRLS